MLPFPPGGAGWQVDKRSHNDGAAPQNLQSAKRELVSVIIQLQVIYIKKKKKIHPLSLRKPLTNKNNKKQDVKSVCLQSFEPNSHIYILKPVNR